MYKIFLVEDDPMIADLTAQGIASWGYSVRCAQDFRNVLDEFQDFSPDLVLLDISLPFYNGYHWCSEIRKTSRIPIVFLSSAADNMSIVMAISQGADDFIAKPFDLGVLAAKISAILRRTYTYGEPPPALRCRGAELDLSGAKLHYAGSALDLTRNEVRILETLLSSKGRIVSRETLMERLWATDSFIDENTLTVNVARLRKKLEAFGLADFIRTKKGMGYVIQEEAL